MKQIFLCLLLILTLGISAQKLPTGVTVDKSEFISSTFLFSDSNDVIYVADNENKQIRKIEQVDGGYNVSTVTNLKAFSGDNINGTLEDYELDCVDAAAIDGEGNLILVEANENTKRNVLTW